MNYFYRIKVPKLFEGVYSKEWEYKPIDVGYIEADSKSEARKMLELDYNKTLAQRVKKSNIGNENIYLLQLYDPDPYFDKVWNEKQKCSYCDFEFSKLNRDKVNDFTHIRYGFCSVECDIKANNEKVNSENPNYDLWGNNQAVVYRIQNKLTNKSYVGKTTKEFTFRWYQHFKISSSTKFRTAINESKLSDWLFEIVEVLENYNQNKDRELLQEREQHWITFYDSVNNGYNSINASNS